MTKRTFTDSEGQEYELTPLIYKGNQHYTLKPIPKAVEKRTYRLSLLSDLEWEEDLLVKDFELTKPQALAISAMLEAAMEVSVWPDSNRDQMLLDAVAVARAVLQEDKPHTSTGSDVKYVGYRQTRPSDTFKKEDTDE